MADEPTSRLDHSEIILRRGDGSLDHRVLEELLDDATFWELPLDRKVVVTIQTRIGEFNPKTLRYDNCEESLISVKSLLYIYRKETGKEFDPAVKIYR